MAFNLAPTASTTAMLAMGDALAMAILDARGFSKEKFAKHHPAGSIGRALLLLPHHVVLARPDVRRGLVAFLRRADGRHAACSLWRDQAAVDALARSTSYIDTATGLAATGAPGPDSGAPIACELAFGSKPTLR